MPITYDSAAPTAWETEILALEQQSSQAFLTGDVATLDHLWAPQFVVNSPLNRIHDRQTVLDLLGSGRIRHLSLDAVIERMVRVADTIIVMGRDLVADPPDGRQTARRFTNIWSRIDGSWQIIARHAQAIPAPAGG